MVAQNICELLIGLKDLPVGATKVGDVMCSDEIRRLNIEFRKY